MSATKATNRFHRAPVRGISLAVLFAMVAAVAFSGHAEDPALPSGEGSTAWEPASWGESSLRLEPLPCDATSPQAVATPANIPAYPLTMPVGQLVTDATGAVRLCQWCGSAAISGVDCQGCGSCGEAGWNQWGPIPWEVLAQGEYVGPSRIEHVPEYRIRVDDQLEFVYRLTRQESAEPYKLNVGDSIRVESLTDKKLDRELVIQPDGTITLRLLGQVRAAGRTVVELTDEIEELYEEYYRVPAMTVTPIAVDTKLKDLLAAVDNRFSAGGQTRDARVTPEGTVQLPAIGSVPAQGLSLDELKREIDARYNDVVMGIEVTPVLRNRAPRFVFVVGEVQQSGRFELEGPTTVMQAIALAGGWNKGCNLREIVIFRRAEDWRLLATRLDLRGALLGARLCPADEIWLRDSDIVVVPKRHILRANDFIELIFARGIYGVMPFDGMSINYSKLSTI